MATSKIKKQGWKLITTVKGANTANFEDLASQGYTEVCVCDGGYGSASIPVCAIPPQGISLCWGGLYGGVNGLLRGVDLYSTRIKGKYGRTDSSDVLSSTTFYLYAK